MIGGIISSLTTFIALRTNAVQSIGNWLNGNFLSSLAVGTKFYISIPLLIVTYIFANYFDCWYGKDFSHNLGVNYERIMMYGLAITATMTALVVVTVGALPF